MKELSLKMKLFPCLVNLLLGDQIRLFGITNDTTSSLSVALIPVGNCTSIGPSHSLEILHISRENTPGSSSSPKGILIREERHI